MVLLIEALMCMMCVSKKFYSLISSSEFIKRHFVAALKEGNNFMLFDPNFVSDEHEKPFYLLSYEKPTNFSTMKRIPNVIYSDCYQIDFGSASFVFIIDTESRGDIIHLWSPFIRKSLSITISTIGLEKFTFNDSRHLVLGFGYVSQKDHLIVQILYVEDEENEFLHLDMILAGSSVAPRQNCQKKTLSHLLRYFHSEDTWEKIELPVFPWYLCDSISRAFVNNSVHWIPSHVGGDSNDNEPVILSFRLLNEVFGEIKLPAYYNIEVSEMDEEYENEASGTKEFDAVLDRFVHFPSLITSNDEIAIIRTNVGDGKLELCLHDLVLLDAKPENMEVPKGIDDDEEEKEALDTAGV
ncbi:OLC1v1024769C1 [Oldenlandia corymbosa var. corymbosa]|uniref:OLC1v1024769C1 n=1 Tax=Oldenlandia corymbosa var. corymbosa TaxID=529605 RepID=A0AAV1C351_OLDCO|nr:OLC1v1024769C1 [Oldenlandia corymbosa var. corymbosa]